jgi:hypothetical protein
MAVRNSTSNSGSSNTPAATVPSGAASGDIAVILVTIDSNSADFAQGTWPSGFTRLDEVLTSTTDGMSSAIGWKRLSAGDAGSYTFAAVGGSGDWVAQCALFSGRHASNNPVASTLAQQTTGQNSPVSIAANGVTAVLGDDLLWCSTPDTTDPSTSTGHTPPAGFAELQDAQSAWATASMAAAENVVAGATGTVTGSFSMSGITQAGWGAWLIRIPAGPSLTDAQKTQLAEYERSRRRAILTM